MRLLERDRELGELSGLWSEAAAGHGQLVFVSGEAGVGKTSLGRELARRVSGRARVLIGICDAAVAPRPLGPLDDIATELGLPPLWDETAGRLPSLFPLVRDALKRAPTLWWLEDVHWADQATLDLLRYLGRRLEGVPAVVLVTVRDDELTGTHPLVHLMGELATAPGVVRLPLTPFTVAAVEHLVAEGGHELDGRSLHARTGGNPFFVTEVLAAGADELPATVRDAVAARAARLTPGGRRTLDAAAVVGSTAEIDLLLDVAGGTPGAVDDCVRSGVLLDRGTAVAFRHELARQAVLDQLLPAARIGLHRRVLDGLAARGSTDHRRMAAHALAAGDSAAVLRHAPAAADHAARLGSHREAASQLRTALAHADGLADPDRAPLLERYSYECYLTDQVAEALSARREAVELHLRAGDTRRVGVGQRWVSRLSWFLGRHVDAERYALLAVDTLEPLGPGLDLAMAYSNVSHLRMLSASSEEALTWGRRALERAREAGARDVESHALNNMGTALFRRGDLVEGRTMLEESLAIALADDLAEHAARCWTNLGTVQASKRMLRDAEQTMGAGIAYCEKRDLDSWSVYLQAWLAGVLVEQGRVDEGARLAGEVLDRPHLSLVSRIPALLATNAVALRRGAGDLGPQLAQIQELASSTAEPQRLLPVALLRAEAAWTDDRAADIRRLTDEVWRTCTDDWGTWILAELAWWRRLGGVTDDVIAFELPSPFALMREGRARQASAAWGAIGRPWWSALALADGSPAEASEAVSSLIRMGAPATAQAVRRDLARRGRPVPRGPRGHARSNPAGLTARELDVLGFLVDGRSDAEIAARLTLSERTVSHHVSAVLRKLAVPSRSRAAAVAGPILAGTRSA